MSRCSARWHYFSDCTLSTLLVVLVAAVCSPAGYGNTLGRTAEPGLQPSVNALLGRWQIQQEAANAARFENPAQDLHVTVAGRVTTLYLADNSRLQLRFDAYRVDDEAQPVRASFFGRHGTHLDIDYGAALNAWYVNNSIGVEQGFTLKQKLGAAGTTQLIFSLGGNLRAQHVGNGLLFVNLEGRPVLRYAGLYAYDADHRRLPAQIRLHGRQMELRVTTRGARFPVIVDPLFAGVISQTEPIPGNNHYFGYTVALSGDGQTALVGVPGANTAYVFSFQNNQWMELRQLTDPQNTISDAFGQAVALSGDGSTALVGAPGTASGGAAYVFVAGSGSWSGTPIPLSDPGNANGDKFGGSVALSQNANSAVVGAPGTSVSTTGKTVYTSTGAGSAYVYSSSNWNTPAYTLSDPDALNATANGVANGFNFGSAVALSASGSTALVGAPDASVSNTVITGSGSNQTTTTYISTAAGAAYIYVNGALTQTWEQPDAVGATANSVANDFHFGAAVALGNGSDAALIGEPGASVSNTVDGTTYISTTAGMAFLYVYDKSWPSSATQLFLDPVAANASSNGAGNGDVFGQALSLDAAADAAFIAAPGTSVSGKSGAGAAYLWINSGSPCADGSAGPLCLTAAPTEGTAASGDAFGTSVALSANAFTGLVGAPNATTDSYSSAGAAYMYFPTVDLSVALTSAPSSTDAPGATLNYGFTITNNDSSVTASGVQFTDTISGSGISVTSATSGCSVNSSGSAPVTATVSCSFASLNPDAIQNIAIQVATTALQPTVVSSAASVSGNQQDPNPGNNSVSNSVTVDVAPTANNTSVTAYVTFSGTLSATPGYSGQNLTYSIVKPPSDGTVIITDATTGAYTYTVNAAQLSNGTASDSFKFQVGDGLLVSNTATVSVTAYGPPVAKANTIVQPIDVAGSVSLTSLVSDPAPGASYTYTIVSNPLNGTLSGSNGTYTYTSNPGVGEVAGGQPDSFSFKVTDNHGNSSNTATYTLQVYGPPVVPASGSLVVHNGSGTGSVSAVVPDAQLIPTYSLDGPGGGCSGPSHGSVTFSSASSSTKAATYTYIPTDPTYTGPDCFTYVATVTSTDKTAPSPIVSNQGVVNVTVYAPPVAQGASITAHVSTSGQFVATDSDPSQTLVYHVITQPTHGSLNLNSATGAYTYTVAAGAGQASGGTPDSFVYDVTDQYSTSAPATVNVTDYAAPTASASSLVAHVNASGQLQAFDPDITQVLTYNLVALPSHGSVTLNAATGAYTYHASPGYDGSDSFSFNAHDAFNASNNASVAVTVYSAPIARSGTLSTNENVPASGQLIASDPDPAQKLTYYVVLSPSHGSVALDAASGAYTYTPASGYSGSDVLTFAVKDAFNSSNTEVINVSVAQTSNFGTSGSNAGPPPPAQSGGGAMGWLVLPWLVGLVWHRRRRGTHLQKT